MRVVRRRAARAVVQASSPTDGWCSDQTSGNDPGRTIGPTGSKQIGRPRSGNERPRSDRERGEAG